MPETRVRAPNDPSSPLRAKVGGLTARSQLTERLPFRVKFGRGEGMFVQPTPFNTDSFFLSCREQSRHLKLFCERIRTSLDYARHQAQTAPMWGPLIVAPALPDDARSSSLRKPAAHGPAKFCATVIHRSDEARGLNRN